MDIMDKVLESVANSGGASVNLASGSTPAGGYMVSRAGSEVVFRGGLSRERLEQFAQAYKDELDNSDTYLGVWADDETGLVYLDISDNLDNLDTAWGVGVEREQLAIYAVSTGETIRIEGK